MHAGEVQVGMTCWAVLPTYEVAEVGVVRDGYTWEDEQSKAGYFYCRPVGDTGPGLIVLQVRNLHPTRELALLGALENANSWVVRQQTELDRVKEVVKGLREQLTKG